jgi:hypothetical protein
LLYGFVNPVISSDRVLTSNYGVMTEFEIGAVLNFENKGRLWFQHIKTLHSPAWTFQNSFEKIKVQGSYYLDLNKELRFSAEDRNVSPIHLQEFLASFFVNF